MITLNKTQEGDKLKLTKNGCVWTVIKKTSPNEHFNGVICLTNKNGTSRIYSSRDKAWNRQVWNI